MSVGSVYTLLGSKASRVSPRGGRVKGALLGMCRMTVNELVCDNMTLDPASGNQRLLYSGAGAWGGCRKAAVAIGRDLFMGGSAFVQFDGRGAKHPGDDPNNQTDGEILGLTRSGSDIYACGDTLDMTVGGVHVHRAAVYDAAAGTWAPSFDNTYPGTAKYILANGGSPVLAGWAQIGPSFFDSTVFTLVGGVWTPLTAALPGARTPYDSVLGGECWGLAWYGGDLYTIGQTDSPGPPGGGGGAACWGIHYWDGAAWNACGQGIDSAGYPLQLCEFKGLLYVAGNFGYVTNYPPAVNVMTGGLATWDGTSWAKVHGLTYGQCFTLIPYGDQLFVAGFLPIGPGGATRTRGLWDGSNWTNIPEPDGLTGRFSGTGGNVSGWGCIYPGP